MNPIWGSTPHPPRQPRVPDRDILRWLITLVIGWIALSYFLAWLAR